MTPEKHDCTVMFYIDGELTPLSLATAIIESKVIADRNFREFVDYLSVHVEHHCQHGKG